MKSRPGGLLRPGFDTARRIVHNVGVEVEIQPAPPDTEKKTGATGDARDGGVTGSVETLDRLIAITSNTEKTCLVLAIAVGFAAVGLLLGLYLTRQLHVVGAIGSAATAAVAAVPVALMGTQRARLSTLRATRERAFRVSADLAQQKAVADAINVLIAILT